MKYAVQIFFAIILIVCMYLAQDAYFKLKSDVFIAVLSVAISIISAWVAYLSFAAYAESDAPQLVLQFDSRSRYSLLQIKLTNYGTKPAFDIKINWDREIIGIRGRVVQFNRDSPDCDIKVLNANESVFAFVNGTNEYYKSTTDENYDYSGFFTYKKSLNSRFKQKNYFIISAQAMKHSLLSETETPKTEHELQKIPTLLKEISSSLKEMNRLASPKIDSDDEEYYPE
jgi:hypothetical protein